MDNLYKYKAFISYRHKEPDKAVAVRLQKKLEGYRPPKAIAGKSFKKWRLFRDETELQTSSDLSEDIKEALRESEFLLVICSESTKDSKWCTDEMKYFKELHNGSNEKIITVVASGKPETVFPEILRTQKVQTLDEAGNVVLEDKEAEPLAANITDSDGKTSFSKLNEEYLRIAAAFLDCDYDDLYRRNQKRAIKRVIIIGSAILTVLLAFGIFATAMMINLNREKERAKAAEAEAIEQRDLAEQRLLEVNAEKERADANFKEAEAQRIEADANFKEAEAQKRKADANYEEAKEQKRIADENYENAKEQKRKADENANEAQKQKNEAEKNMRTAQENEAKANEANRNLSQKSADVLAREAKSLLSDGKRTEAVKAAVEAVKIQKDAGILVSGESQKILADAVCAYEEYYNFTNKRSVNLADWAEQLLYLPESDYFIAADGKYVYSVSMKTGEILKTKKFEDSINKVYLIGNSLYVLSNESQFFVLDYDTLDLRWEYAEKRSYSTNTKLVFSPDGKIICLTNGKWMRFFSDTGERQGQYEENFYGENSVDDGNFVLSNDGHLYTTNPWYEDVEKQRIYDLNIYDGMYYWYDIDKKDNVSSLYCDDNNLFINFTEGEKGQLVCKNRADFSTKWETEYYNEGGISPSKLHETVLVSKDGTDFLVLIAGRIVASVNRDTGEVIANYAINDYAEGIIDVNEGKVRVLTNEGYVYCEIERANTYNVYEFGEKLIDSLIISEKYKTDVVGYTTSAELLMFSKVYKENKYDEEIIPKEEEEYFQTDAYAENGSGIIATIKEKWVGAENKKLYVYDVKTKTLLQTIDFISEEQCFLEFYGKDKLLVWDKYNVYLYSIKGELLSSLSLEHYAYGGYALYKDYLVLYGITKNSVINIGEKGLTFKGFTGCGDFAINSSGEGVFVMKDKENQDTLAYGRINGNLSYVVADGETFKTFGKPIYVNISDKGNIIAFIFNDESLNVYDKSKKTLKTISFSDKEKKPDECIISPDEKYIITLSSDYKTLNKYSVEDLSLKGTVTSNDSFITLTQMKFVSENDLLLTDPGNIAIIDIATMTIRASLPDGGFFVESENLVIEDNVTRETKMYKYLTADELLVKAEEFLNTYGAN